MNYRKLIVFDMDGVIVDVSKSYRDVVRQTAGLFFQPARSSEKLPRPLFELSDLAAVKQSGGLNNDWDLTFMVISLLFSLVDKLEVYKDRNPLTQYRQSIEQCEVDALSEFLLSTAKPLTTLLKKRGKQEDRFIRKFYTGDVGSGNIIKQIFQEIYLGPELFKATYNMESRFYKGEGFILREELLIDRSILEALSKENILAIATGRPAKEAEYPLEHFQLNKFFKHIMTLDDCIREEKRIFREEGKAVSLSKPNPFMLDAIVANQKEVINDYFYIGDMPDDMLAAARSPANFKSIGILISASDKSGLKRELQRAGANYIVEDFEGLKKITL